MHLTKHTPSVALLLMLLLLLALLSPAVTATATENTDEETSEETDTYSLSIKAVDSGETEHVYAVYQIFTGTVVTTYDDEGNVEKTTLAEITAGANLASSYTSDPLAAAEAIIAATANEDGSAVTDATLLATIAEYVSMGAGTTPYAAMKGGETVSLPTGYYLVVDLGFAAETSSFSVTPTVSGSSDDDSEVSTSSSTTYYYTPLYDEEAETAVSDASYSLYLAVLLTADQTDVARKTDEPSVVKEVLEADDSVSSTGDTSGEGSSDASDTWGETADYDIGDAVTFRLTATMPDATSYSYYDTYILSFTDTLSAGLTLDGTATSDEDGNSTTDYSNNIAVTVTSASDSSDDSDTSSGSEVVTLTYGTDYSIDVTVNTDGTTTLVITLGYKDANDSDATFEADVKKNSKLTGGETITVTYTATLNSAAATDGSGDTNTVYLTYSNNPNDSAATTTSTQDTVYVFTYRLTIYKVAKSDGSSSEVTDSDTTTNTDEEESETATTYEALTGAEFTLYKYYTETTTSEDETTTTTTQYWKEVSQTTTDSGSEDSDEGSSGNTSGSTFSWNGLDEGYYKLVETTTPNGYLTMDDLYFQVSATTSVSDGIASITSLTATEVTATENEDGTWTFTKVTSEDDTSSNGILTAVTISTSSDAEDSEEEEVVTYTGLLTGYVVNESGLSLPTTGAYSLVLLIAAVAVILIVVVVLRRRSGRDGS